MKLEVFFDYICPFCLRSYRDLVGILAEWHDIEVEWRPCEAHPRPEKYGFHSDLCARGMYVVKDHNVALRSYHENIFRVAQVEKADVEDIRVVAKAVRELMSERDFIGALERGDHAAALADNNRVAWGECGFMAVPSLRIGENILPAVPEIGLTKEDMERFIRENDYA